jgi:uncharacterized membrane protein
MHTLYTLSVFVHILAACSWIGAMIFFAVAVVPVIRRPEYRSVFAELVRDVGARFRVLGWVSVLVLIATGHLQPGAARLRRRAAVDRRLLVRRIRPYPRV